MLWRIQERVISVQKQCFIGCHSFEFLYYFSYSWMHCCHSQIIFTWWKRSQSQVPNLRYFATFFFFSSHYYMNSQSFNWHSRWRRKLWTRETRSLPAQSVDSGSCYPGTSIRNKAGLIAAHSQWDSWSSRVGLDSSHGRRSTSNSNRITRKPVGYLFQGK